MVSSLHPAGGQLPSLEDRRVAGAPAQVSCQCLADVVARRSRIRLEQRLGREQDAWRAVAALCRPELGERLLQRMELTPGGHPFDRRDRAALDLDWEQEAAQRRLAVDEHRARAALAQLAAMLGARELHVLAQNLEERLVHRQQQLAPLAVDIQRTDVPIDRALYLVSQLESSIVRRAWAQAHRSGAIACARLDAGTGSSGWTRIVRIPSMSAGSMSFSSRLPITTHCSGWTPARRIAISNTAG